MYFITKLKDRLEKCKISFEKIKQIIQKNYEPGFTN